MFKMFLMLLQLFLTMPMQLLLLSFLQGLMCLMLLQMAFYLLVWRKKAIRRMV